MKQVFNVLFFFLITFTSGMSQNFQSPAEYLGYELGERFTRHHRTVEYFKHIAENSPKVRVKKYGETYEKRELITAIIASEENIARIDEIRAANLQRAGMGNTESSSPPEVAIVWLSYNVHGNESVSMEASMQTLYELADPKNDRSKEWLKNTVVIMDPCINPDGRDRYANFYNQWGNLLPNPDPQSKEHDEPWPGGRANHYLFDLNRDWAWLKQVESQQRMAMYQEWLPHVHVDFHEQGVNSPYYFAPAAEPFHEVITNWQREFQQMIGKNNARYFDENNWLYFTKERFDLLYPSYGDTYPIYNGAIGMTYEQGGSGRAGLTVTTEFGDELTLKDRIAHHHSNGLSTVEVTSKNASRVLEEFEEFYAKKASSFKYKSYLIKTNTQQAEIEVLCELLDKHKIVYGRPAAGRKAVSGFSFRDNSSKSVSVESSDLLIPLDQPKATLVSVLFEPKTKLVDSLTYDITAWAIPYAYGLDAYALETSLSISRPYSTPETEVTSISDAYAYIFSYKSLNDAKLLAHLNRQGVNVRVAYKPFSIEGTAFDRGALIVTERNNEELDKSLSSIVESAAKKYNSMPKVVSTGFADSGYDLGSGNMDYIEAPRVALLSGQGVSSLSFGEVWYFMERELEYPLAVLSTDNFSRTNMDKYDVLIVPNGYSGLFDESGMKKLNDWISGGGHLIVMGNALNSFVDKDGFALKRYFDEEAKKEVEKWEEKQENPLETYQNRERTSISNAITGAIFKVSLDMTHPLAFGYDNEYFTLKTSSSRFAWLENGYNVGYLPKSAAALSGFVGYKAAKDVGESLIFGVQNKGRGHVTYMVDNPLFRAFWENGKLFMANAIFVVGQ